MSIVCNDTFMFALENLMFGIIYLISNPFFWKFLLCHSRVICWKCSEVFFFLPLGHPINCTGGYASVASALFKPKTHFPPIKSHGNRNNHGWRVSFNYCTSTWLGLSIYRAFLNVPITFTWRAALKLELNGNLLQTCVDCVFKRKTTSCFYSVVRF